MSNKKYVVQVFLSDDGSFVREIVLGNSERYAEKIQHNTEVTLGPDYYTLIVERPIDKTV